MLSVNILVVFCAILQVQGDAEGYYWRDYDGTIPVDAFAGGLDINNKPIYIGQAFARFLIPAKIYCNEYNNAYYEYGGKEFTAKNNVKILCSQDPEQFEWVKTNNDEMKGITNTYLVIGGYEPGCSTYIGRVRHEGEIAIGKALADNLPQHAGLHVTKNGVGRRYTTFEVLSFRVHG